MFVGVHMLAGAAVGALVPNTAMASGLAVLSHYTLDHFPHWHYLPKYRSRWEDIYKMLIEPLISIPLFLLAAWYWQWDIQLIVPAFVAIIPDVLEGTQYLVRSKTLRWHTRLHAFGHWHTQFWPSLPILASVVVLLSYTILLAH